MKSILTLLFGAVLWSISKPMSGINKTDSSECLIISGNIENLFDNEQGSKSYKVELIYFNTTVDSVIKKDNRSFRFSLKKNSIYTLRITKEGYIPKLISVNTFISEDNKDLYHFHFDTGLMKHDTKGIFDKEALEFPIALVGFNEEKNIFYFNEEYTSNIKRALFLTTTSM